MVDTADLPECLAVHACLRRFGAGLPCERLHRLKTHDAEGIFRGIPMRAVLLAQCPKQSHFVNTVLRSILIVPDALCRGRNLLPA